MIKYNNIARLLALPTAAILFGMFNASCSHEKKSHEKNPVAVKIITVTDHSGINGHEYVGTVEESSGTVLSFEVPGNITLLAADEGDRIARGQLLGKISPTTLKEAHQSTLAALNQARDAYRRMKPLHEQKVISEMQWVDVESKLHQAEAAERIAKEQLSHTSLYAPFSGVIAARYADNGMNVIAGQQIYKLVDISNVNVVISVPEDEIASISCGTKAQIKVKAADGAALEGRVTEKGITANAVSHTYDVKISTVNPSRRLMPGMVCEVTLTGSHNDGQHAIVIPQSCIKLDTDGSRFVWVDANNVAQQRAITTGDFVDGGIVVLQGLKNGDKVITDGSQKVSEGMKITTK